MTLRCCRYCYKTTEDEEHDWFCLFGTGTPPAQAKAKAKGDEPSGSGGSDPGDPNVPILPQSPGGGGAAVELDNWGRTVTAGDLGRAMIEKYGKPDSKIGLGYEVKRPMIDITPKPASIANQESIPLTALPAPVRVERDKKE
jgi:hypothetical protein